jgi:hypothetical protein
MKFLTKMKDGGKESSVTGYWLIEWKGLFSICLLKFEGRSREAYHQHAFNSVSWLVSGGLFEEDFIHPVFDRTYKPSFIPIWTPRGKYHKVTSEGVSWVLTFRGRWSTTWKEYREIEGKEYTLTNGRREL